MKVLICGINGKMGQSIYQELKSLSNVKEIIGFDKVKIHSKELRVYNDLKEALDEFPEVVIDFTNYDIAYQIISEALLRKIKVISGTTGLKPKQIKKLDALAIKGNISFYYTPNFSKGYHLFLKEVTDLKNQFNYIDIIETHNISKIDKPSGTSLIVAKKLGIDKEKIQSLRLQNVLAIHEVCFIDDYEEIVITHKINNRLAFIKGFMIVFNEIISSEV